MLENSKVDGKWICSRALPPDNTIPKLKEDAKTKIREFVDKHMYENFETWFAAFEGGYIRKDLLREDDEAIEEWVVRTIEMFEICDWNQNFVLDPAEWTAFLYGQIKALKARVEFDPFLSLNEKAFTEMFTCIYGLQTVEKAAAQG